MIRKPRATISKATFDGQKRAHSPAHSQLSQNSATASLQRPRNAAAGVNPEGELSFCHLCRILTTYCVFSRDDILHCETKVTRFIQNAWLKFVTPSSPRPLSGHLPRSFLLLSPPSPPVLLPLLLPLSMLVLLKRWQFFC